MTTNLSIVLKRPSKVYHEGETIAGVAVVDSSSDVRHEGLTLYMEGSVNLQLSSKNVGLFDAFTNNIKPINLISASVELAPPGKIPVGVTAIPFELPLGAAPLESYHGVFVSVLYGLRAALRRPLFSKPLNAACQFFVQHVPREPPPPKAARCEVAGAALPAPLKQFHMYAEIDSTICALDKPITGKICVEECSVPIKSIELQLVRVETCGGAEGLSRDATEVQSIQVAEGDVRRGRLVPLHMVLPRLFTCPTTTTAHFKIEFELNIAVIFEDDHLVTENFPILLLRCR